MAGGARDVLHLACHRAPRRPLRQAPRVSRRRGLLSVLPVLFVTHLPDLPFVAVVLFFPFFMVAMSGRMVPMQALLTTVPEACRRGAFLSANSALQALGMGAAHGLAA